MLNRVKRTLNKSLDLEDKFPLFSQMMIVDFWIKNECSVVIFPPRNKEAVNDGALKNGHNMEQKADFTYLFEMLYWTIGIGRRARGGLTIQYH